MRKCLLLFLVTVPIINLHGQGWVSMNTAGAGANARATSPCAEISGTNFLAQLYWGTANAPVDTLISVTNPPAHFGTGSFVGYVVTASGGGYRVLPLPEFTLVTVQIRAWDVGLGSSYEEARVAWMSGASKSLGQSEMIMIRLTLPPVPGAMLLGLPAWSIGPLTCIPEPGSFALLMMGGMALLWRYRKKIMGRNCLLLLLLTVPIPGLFGQGTLSFNTIGAGVNAPVTATCGDTRLSGTQFFAQLYWGTVGIPTGALISVTNPPATFGTGAFAGYIVTASGGGNRVLPVPAGTEVTVQVRVWDRALGASYEEAFAVWISGPPNLLLGRSPTITVTLTTAPDPPAPLAGLPPWCVGCLDPCVPEPTSIALLMLGGVVLLWRHRRKIVSRKWLLLLLLTVPVKGLNGQGTLNFVTYGGVGVNATTPDPIVPGAAVDAPIRDACTGMIISRAVQILGQLYWGAVGTPENALVSITNPPVTFSNGYITAGPAGRTVVLPVPGGTEVTVQIRAWDRALGNDYQTALAAWIGFPGLLRLGNSQMLTMTLGTPPGPPPYLVGLQSWTLGPSGGCVPEPGTLALLLCGGIGFLWWLRQNKS
jgi:PEP-CTERM motif